jgi:transposase
MSLHPHNVGPVPDETARVAHAAFPKGHYCLALRDHIGVLFDDELFAPLFPACGQPAETPWRLALVCVLQFIEGLSDRQAADAVRDRLAWKYLLGLELTDPGFHYSVLSEFRARLVAHDAASMLLDTLLTDCKERGWLKARGQQRTDSTHVLAAIRTLNRLECAGETMRAALNALTVAAPAWLRALAPVEWGERYTHPVEEYRLPKGAAAQRAYAEVVGADGMHLLTAVYAPDAPDWLRQVPAVATLRRVWIQNYMLQEGRVCWRADADLPPAGARIDSPYDPEAHYSIKRSTTWTGYKVHVTETCDPATVHLITRVETTHAHLSDLNQTDAIHRDLAAKALLPDAHLVDAGYIDGGLVDRTRTDYALELVGPMRPDTSWQARTPGAYDLTQFAIDWQAQRATCPQGHTATTWTPHQDAWGTDVITVKFSRTDCRLCGQRSLCTRAKAGPRHLTLRPAADHQAIQDGRLRQQSASWQACYRRRAGIEGTLSQGVRAFGLRSARYLGLAKVRLQHVLTAIAVNLVRLVAWLGGVPHATTRTSRFAALMAA